MLLMEGLKHVQIYDRLILDNVDTLRIYLTVMSEYQIWVSYVGPVSRKFCSRLMVISFFKIIQNRGTGFRSPVHFDRSHVELLALSTQHFVPGCTLVTFLPVS